MCNKLGAVIIAIGTLTSVNIAAGQQGNKVSRIGYLSPSFPAVASNNFKKFELGLRELGYTEGKNITIDFRYAEGKLERLPGLAGELVRLKPNILVSTGGTPAALAAKHATTTIPIVFTSVGDPVASGLVATLAHPGGNITGLTILTQELSGKRLEILKEIFPRISLVAVFWNPSNPSSKSSLKETEIAAKALRLQLYAIEFRGPEDFEGAFQAATKAGAGALIAPTDPLISAYRPRFIELSVKSRLPTIFDPKEFAEAGGLMSYGPDRTEMYRRAATYVDKILKGAKPGDLPIEQPTKFEFVINLKTAKQIGLTISPNVLQRADKVIR